MASAAIPALERPSSSDVTRVWAIAPFALVLAALGGVAAAKLAAQGRPMVICLVALVPVLIALWKWPQVGLTLILAGTALIEQFRYFVGSKKGVFTEAVPLFRSLSNGTGVSPAEILMVT